MNWRIGVGAALMAAAGLGWAQRPLVYPLRSQGPGAQSIDNAYCYWQAKEQTHVDMTHEPQLPLRTEPIAFAPNAGDGSSAPPLPEAAGQGPAANAAQPVHTTEPAAASSVSARATASAATGASAAEPASTSAAALPAVPPLPPPEPPTTRYWQAYGECMQSRGYGVR